MFFFIESVRPLLFMLLVALLQPTASLAVGLSESAGAGSMNTAASVYRTAIDADKTAAARGVAAQAQDDVREREALGDGRAGFWIIGILINLVVMGWFLSWALKEWRKKRDE